jgi:hypothetical protein
LNRDGSKNVPSVASLFACNARPMSSRNSASVGGLPNSSGELDSGPGKPRASLVEGTDRRRRVTDLHLAISRQLAPAHWQNTVLPETAEEAEATGVRIVARFDVAPRICTTYFSSYAGQGGRPDPLGFPRIAKFTQ